MLLSLMNGRHVQVLNMLNYASFYSSGVQKSFTLVKKIFFCSAKSSTYVDQYWATPSCLVLFQALKICLRDFLFLVDIFAQLYHKIHYLQYSQYTIWAFYCKYTYIYINTQSPFQIKKVYEFNFNYHGKTGCLEFHVIL